MFGMLRRKYDGGGRGGINNLCNPAPSQFAHLHVARVLSDAKGLRGGCLRVDGLHVTLSEARRWAWSKVRDVLRNVVGRRQTSRAGMSGHVSSKPRFERNS